jgi:hypothetical protein
MKKITIFIDESGTLPDPKDKVVIVAAVGTEAPHKLVEVIKSIRKYLKSKKNISNEIKFYRSGENTKVKYLNALVKRPIGIFILTVEKNNQRIIDTPENFATLCWILLSECLLFYKENAIGEIIFDKHFHKESYQKKFDKILISLLGKKLLILHVDSKKDSRISAADMIAGSILWYRTGKSNRFYQLFKKQIVAEIVINWKEAKRKFFDKKMSEPA